MPQYTAAQQVTATTPVNANGTTEIAPPGYWVVTAVGGSLQVVDPTTFGQYWSPAGGPSNTTTPFVVSAPAGTTGAALDVQVGGVHVLQVGTQLGGRIAGTVQEGVKDLAVYFGVGPNGDSSRVVFATPPGNPNWEIDNLGGTGLRIFAVGGSFGGNNATALTIRDDSARVQFLNPIQMDAPNQTVAPGAGGAGALPATPAGYVQVFIGMASHLMPYY